MSPGAVSARLEAFRCLRLRPTGLSSSRLKVVPSIGSPACHLTRLTTVPLLGLTCSSTTRLFFLLVVSAVQPRSSLTLGATRRYLYKLCRSRFDGRHNLAHAGTYLKCTRVLNLENSAQYWYIALAVARWLSEWSSVLLHFFLRIIDVMDLHRTPFATCNTRYRQRPWVRRPLIRRHRARRPLVRREWVRRPPIWQTSLRRSRRSRYRRSPGESAI